MVAFNRVKVTVLAVSEIQRIERGSISRGAIAREVPPWADPYVAQLIRKLQDEVRAERQQQARPGHNRISGRVSAA